MFTFQLNFIYDSGKVSGSNIGMLAEIASCQLEYAYLAHLTGKIEHYDRVRHGIIRRTNGPDIDQRQVRLWTPWERLRLTQLECFQRDSI